jgi:cell division protein FtsQ
MSSLPLPANRRLRRSKTKPVIEAPDELAIGLPPFDDSAFRPPGAVLAEVAPPYWKEAIRSAALVVVTLGAAFSCVWGLVRYTRTSPRFSVRVLEVHGNARRSADEIIKQAGVAAGQNIFTTDLEAARAAVLDDPWIETAALLRRLPSTITIDVTEREAAALVAVGPDLYLSTRQGELFKKPEFLDPADLPVVTGIGPDNVAIDRAGVVSAIKRALDLVGEYERTPPAKTMPVQEVHVEDDGSLVLSVGKDAVELRLGKGPYRRRLEQASRVLAELPRRGVVAEVVFLDSEAHPERVVVRMR